VGVEGLLEAGVELLGEATLADLLSFAGVRAVASRSGVAAGTVTYHFPTGTPDSGRPNSGLAEAVSRHALFEKGLPVPRRTAEVLLSEVDNLQQGDLEALARLARASAEDILCAGAPQLDSSYTAYYVCLAAAPQDPVAAQLLLDFYAAFSKPFVLGIDLLAGATSRRFIDGFDAHRYATVLMAVTTGFIERRRFDVEEAPAELLAETSLRLFQALTISDDAADAADAPVPEEMLRLPPNSPLDRSERHRIVKAVREAYHEGGGWAAFSVAAVADRAGVSRAVLSAHFPDRGALAAIVLGGFLPMLRSGIERDRHLPFVQILWRHVQRLIEIARSHPEPTIEYTAAVLRAALARSAPDWGDPQDPRALAPFPSLFVRVLYDHHEEVNPAITASDETALAFSTLVVSTTLHQALATPATASSELADGLVALILDGVRVRPRS
jgi:AcrR family transcriptional regulator